MYISNFKLLALFGRELCEKQTQKMRKVKKTDQKTTSFKLRAGEMGKKSRGPQKAHVEPLPNVHSKF